MDLGYSIFAVEQAEPSTSLFDWDISKDGKYALVFGHEVDGVSEAALDFATACIEIPQFGTKHSLNISVSVGIVLWEMVKKLKGGS
jgi:tRNA G18 (ribose-2'-O)-methylase SpoU